MNRNPVLTTLALFSLILLTTAYRPAKPNNFIGKEASPAGVHFKIDGKQYDIPQAWGIYLKDKGGRLAIYNAGLPGFPETTISLAIGSDFKGSPGTFKGDANDKGFVFTFTLGKMQNMIGYAAGKDDPEHGFTVASTPISITIASFSETGISTKTGNVTAQGSFSGKVYDFKNKKTVNLTDGTFSVQGSN